MPRRSLAVSGIVELCADTKSSVLKKRSTPATTQRRKERMVLLRCTVALRREHFFLLLRSVRMQGQVRQLPVLNSFRWTFNEKQIYSAFRNIQSDFVNSIGDWLRNLPLLPDARRAGRTILVSPRGDAGESPQLACTKGIVMRSLCDLCVCLCGVLLLGIHQPQRHRGHRGCTEKSNRDFWAKSPQLRRRGSIVSAFICLPPEKRLNSLLGSTTK